MGSETDGTNGNEYGGLCSSRVSFAHIQQTPKETVALPNVGADFRLCKLRYQAFYYRLLQHFLGLS